MSAVVFGPAYVDRVVRTDAPLHEPGQPPIDRSVSGSLNQFERAPLHNLVLRDPNGKTLHIELPREWDGPEGMIQLTSPAGDLSLATSNQQPLHAVCWSLDLGGMGAGYAKAMDAALISALGGESDADSIAVANLLRRQNIPHWAIRIAGVRADWTLLISSGPHGDKLAVGFRGCHARLEPALLPAWHEVRKSATNHLDLVLVAGLSNSIARHVFQSIDSDGSEPLRVFAPSLRNMTDRSGSIAAFAPSVDLMTCNEHEWSSLETADREAIAQAVRWLIITRGSQGATIHYRSRAGLMTELTVPAFPRSHPPRDTNRAGETFASEFINHLRKTTPGDRFDREIIALGAQRASAAAALGIDLLEFGFPTREQVDDAIRLGRID